MTNYVTIREVHAIGVKVGMPPEHLHGCGHLWGEHLLYAEFDDILDGGSICCSVQGCTCYELWSLKDTDKLKAARDKL